MIYSRIIIYIDSSLVIRNNKNLIKIKNKFKFFDAIEKKVTNEQWGASYNLDDAAKAPCLYICVYINNAEF